MHSLGSYLARFAKWPFRGIGLSNASHEQTSWSRREGELALMTEESKPPQLAM